MAIVFPVVGTARPRDVVPAGVFVMGYLLFDIHLRSLAGEIVREKGRVVAVAIPLDDGCRVAVDVAHDSDRVVFVHSLQLVTEVVSTDVRDDDRAICNKEVFYLTTHSTHFIYCYMASHIW